MKYEEWIIQLKSELDPFDQLDMKTFAKAMAYFEFKKYRKGAYLKFSGKTDLYFRYIIKGIAVFSHPTG